MDYTAASTVTANVNESEWSIGLAITAKNLKLKSLYTGEWLSEWTVGSN